MAVGKWQPFVKDDTIYCMNTDTGGLFKFDESQQTNIND